MLKRQILALVAATSVGAALALGVGLVVGAPDTALPWSVSGGGGSTNSSSSNYQLGSTAGQTAIGPAGSAGYNLGAGFWYGGCADPDADGVTSCPPLDNCPDTANPGQQNAVHPGTPAGDHCEDPEPDGVFDIADNCPDTANAGQENLDGDGLGDACDPDDDGDLVNDDAEASCGSDPMDVTPPLSRPERIDGAFAGVDDDGDTLIDEALPAGAANFDCDGDGYKGSAEAAIYSPSTAGDQDPCGNNGWPSDLAAPVNRISISDVTSFTSPAPKKLNTIPTDPGYNVRWDIKSPFTTIVLGDLTTLTAGLDGSPNKPPMLGGVRAFNGPSCPWP